MGGEGIAMSGIDLFGEAMSAKHAEQSGDFSGAAAFFFRGIGGGVPEEAPEIAVTEAVDGEFAAIERLEELGIFRGPGAQSADAFVVVGRGLANATKQLAQRGGGIDRGQGVEVAVVGSLSDVSAAGNIADAFAHGAPGFRAVRIAFGGARSEEHTSELQSRGHLVCRLLLEKKKY